MTQAEIEYVEEIKALKLEITKLKDKIADLSVALAGGKDE